MASNSIDFLKIILRGTLQWPRLNQTYRYNPAIKKSEACAPTAMGASWSVSIEMPKAQAKEIYDQAVAHYNACRQRNTTLPKFETVFGMSKNDPDFLEAKLRYFIGCSLVVILAGTIFTILYSLVFVTQPLGESSENDRKFFELLTPIASFIVGALGGVMAAGNNRNRGSNDEPPAPL